LMQRFLYVKLQIVKYTCVYEIDYKNLLQIILVTYPKLFVSSQESDGEIYILLIFLCSWLVINSIINSLTSSIEKLLTFILTIREDAAKKNEVMEIIMRS
jgi:hypothetical protein